MGARTNEYGQYYDHCPFMETCPVTLRIRTKATVKRPGQVIDQWPLDDIMKDHSQENGHGQVEQENAGNGMTEAAHRFLHLDEVGEIRGDAACHQPGKGEPALFSEVKRHGQGRVRKGEGHGQRKEEMENEAGLTG